MPDNAIYAFPEEVRHGSLSKVIADEFARVGGSCKKGKRLLLCEVPDGQAPPDIGFLPAPVSGARARVMDAMADAMNLPPHVTAGGVDPYLIMGQGSEYKPQPEPALAWTEPPPLPQPSSPPDEVHEDE